MIRLKHRDKSQRDFLTITYHDGEQLHSLYRMKDVRLDCTQHRERRVGCSDPTGECRLDNRVSRVIRTRGSRVVGTVVVR